MLERSSNLSRVKFKPDFVMKHVFSGKRIEGILTILPPREVIFVEEVRNYPFPEKQCLRLAKVMGYDKKRICEVSDSVSEYAIYGIQKLLKVSLLDLSEIGAIVVVTTTPDYFTPPVSNLIHGTFGFSKDVMCVDINQACAGYIIGLMQSFLFLDILKDKKVLLIAGDLLSKKVSLHDRASRPLIGDAVTVSVIANSSDQEKLYMTLKNDGRYAMVLNIPAGGFKRLSDSETAIEREDEDGNLRALDHLKMKGDAVFDFVIHEVPDMIEEILEFSGYEKSDIDYYLFHQPNKFILQKLANELDIVHEKMPCNIVEKFGNSSSATIPVNISHNLSSLLLKGDLQVCLSGFGAGLTWGAIVMKLYRMKFCSVVDFEGE